MATEQKFDFYTVAEWKTKIGKLASDDVEVVKNPNGGKLFVNFGGDYFKCQQDIDNALPIRMMVVDGDEQGACLINVAESSNVLFTLS